MQATKQGFDKLYINGSWVKPAGKGTIDVINASTEEVMGRVPEGTAADVDKAVKAAREAFDSWSQTPPEERGKYVQRIQEGLAARMGEIGTTIAKEVGMPSTLANIVQAGLPTMVTASYVDIASDFPWEEQIGNSLVV